ncbi:toxin-antitoxin system YwqK family antitoxin [Tenacibaculum amylolyticum]|uniref:toxin-antitoxin system YwqK family antitoxin n=1 Tax=Tenacibaculum amylolyticum TaxID=104269 RepID=UPI0038B56455
MTIFVILMLMNKMTGMKKLMILACVLTFGILQAQEIKPLYEKDGDLIKVTHFYDNGKIKEQGYYKDKLLHGVWKRFDEKGDKTVVAQYNLGKKVGKWLVWTKEGLKEVNYENNAVASVQSRKEGAKLAIK